MSEQPNDLKNIVEAALFSSDAALSMQRISSMFPRDAKPAKEEIEIALGSLQRDYAGRGVVLRKIGNTYRFQTRQEYAAWLGKLAESRPPRYSRALLETLAIIAYRQPVTRGDIEDIRGVTVSTDIMRTLLDREWIKQVGTRDVPGHPALFGTTREFLEYFNLSSLKELPDLNVEREITEIAQELNLDLALIESDTNQVSVESTGMEDEVTDNDKETMEVSEKQTDEHFQEAADIDAGEEEDEYQGSAEITDTGNVVVAWKADSEIEEETLVTKPGD
jgi:segregation and condensation protein B